MDIPPIDLSTLKKFVIVNPETLEIVSRYYHSVSLFDGCADSYPHIEIPPEMDLNVVLVNADMEVYEDPALVAARTEAAWTALRKERNACLAACDWTQLRDVPESPEWATYRQSLRDLPSETVDPLEPAWPQPPF